MSPEPSANYPNFVKLQARFPKYTDQQIASKMGVHLIQVIAWRARLKAERKWKRGLRRK